MFGFVLVLPLMLIIITGNLLRSRGFYSERDIKTLTKTLYWVILPPLLFKTTFMSGMDIRNNPKILIAVFISSLITMLFVWLVGNIYFHKNNSKRLAVSVLASIRSNTIYIGLPLSYLVMGDVGFNYAAMFIAISYVPRQLLSIYFADVVLMESFKCENLLKQLRKITLNPLILACLAGLLFSFFKIDIINNISDNMIKILSNSATAIALISLGGTLNFSDMTSLIRIFADTWQECVFRFVVNPMIMWLVMYYLKIDFQILMIAVLITAMPTSIDTFVLAKELGGDDKFAADIATLTTTFSIVAIPIWIRILNF
ncbi:MAG: AEC family transporter [Synergistota bacterium]|nr:AEC family transporter [Synergistota bacterium]